VRALFVSLLIHAGIIAAGLIYLPKASQVMENTPIVPVQLVALSERTNVRAAAPDPEPEPEDLPEETIEDAIEEPVSAPEPEPVAPEVEPELIDPDPVTPEPDPEPEPEPDPVEPEPEPEPEPDPPAPVTPQRQPERPSEPSLEDMLGDIERQVAETRTSSGTPDTGDRRASAGDGSAMTATLQDMVSSHLSRCWRNSLDAPEPDELGVTLQLQLSRNGELSGPPRLVDQARILNSPNPYLRIAGERAMRAAVECQPYPLPPEAYSQWRQIEVNFSPELYNR